MPPEAARAGADRVWTMGWAFWARRRLRGLRLLATDTDWSAGAGAELRGPMYDRMHAEIFKRVGMSIDGFLVHIGRATTDGFQVLEVWESKEHYDRANTDIVFPPDAGARWRSASTLNGACNRNLRRTRPCHPQRQHPDLADRGVGPDLAACDLLRTVCAGPRRESSPTPRACWAVRSCCPAAVQQPIRAQVGISPRDMSTQRNESPSPGVECLTMP
jgi:hypothetical protein